MIILYRINSNVREESREKTKCVFTKARLICENLFSRIKGLY